MDFWEVRCNKSSSWVWKFDRKKYRISDVWNVIGPKAEKIVWFKLIWGSKVIPKHALICWMTILNRLPIMDRLKGWGEYVYAL